MHTQKNAFLRMKYGHQLFVTNCGSKISFSVFLRSFRTTKYLKYSYVAKINRPKVDYFRKFAKKVINNNRSSLNVGRKLTTLMN